MEVTTKELRIQPGKILEQVVNGDEITVTFRGKALAKIIPFKNKDQTSEKEESTIFGLWKEHERNVSVEEYVRTVRKGRRF